MAKKPRNGQYANQNRMADQLDNLAAYDEFNSTILPRLQKAMRENWSPEKIYKEFGAYVAGRAVNIALTEQDPGKAMTAVVEVLNRGHGRPKEVIENTHKYSKLSDDELSNLLASTLQAADNERDDDEKLPN